jgi:hypothetical protein
MIRPLVPPLQDHCVSRKAPCNEYATPPQSGAWVLDGATTAKEFAQLATSGAERQMTPEVDSVAPDFTLCDSTGAVRSLTELVVGGRRVLLFYRGHW